MLTMSVARRSSSLWQSAARLAQETYRSYYRAEVEPNPDCFLTAQTSGPDGPEMTACVGFTFCQGAPLFSEQYLDGPLEKVLAREFGSAVARDRLVEVGSLASQSSGAGREIIRLTPVVAWYMGMEYILCTTTQQLRGMLDRAEISFTPLGEADPNVLSAEQRLAWGAYYDQRPQVGVIPLRAMSPLFTEMTGRYSFLDTDLTIRQLDGEHEEVLSGAGH